MGFIKVTAIPCNPDGSHGVHANSEAFLLNIDLIGAVKGNEILIKGAKVVQLGENFYTKVFLQVGVIVSSL